MVKLLESNLSFVFTLNDESVTFPLKIINKRNLVVEHQTTLLNEYLSFKGYEYQEKLITILKEIHNEITYTASSKTLEKLDSLPILIEHLDIEDIKSFLFDIKKIRVPSNIIQEFSKEMREDGRWSEEQTFTTYDYRNLAAEAIRMKILLGPLNYYYYVNTSKFLPVSVEYNLVFLLLEELYNSSEAIVKVKSMVGKLINGVDFRAVIIDKKLPADKLDDYVTSIIMIQRIATAVVLTDNETKNIITTIYSYGYNKLTISGDISKIIRDKIPVSKEEADTVSVIEGYKAVTKVTPGDVEKVLWVTNCNSNNVEESLNFILHNSPKYIKENCNVKMMLSNKHILNVFKDDTISDFTKMLTKLIFKRTINSRAMNNLRIENMENLIMVGYEFLSEIGFKSLADMFVAREIDYTEISINNLKKKDKIIYTNLEKYYPGGLGEKFVNSLTDKLLSKSWINYSGPIKLPENIVNDLASLMINLVENFN